VKRILIDYKHILGDVIDLVEKYEGYFDGDRHAAVLPWSEELIEELENRGIEFKVEVME